MEHAMHYNQLPDTPYFRTLKTIIYEDPLVPISHEILDDGDQVDFKRETIKRNCQVPFEDGGILYVDLAEIRKTSENFANYLGIYSECRGLRAIRISALSAIANIKSSDFEIFLRHICPSSSGLYKEELNIETTFPILVIALTFNLEKVVQSCSEFICSNRIKKMSINDLFNLLYTFEGQNNYNLAMADEKVIFSMRKYLTKTLLEHEDQKQLKEQINCGGKFIGYSLLKFAIKRITKLRHSETLITSSILSKCSFCPPENQGERLFERKLSSYYKCELMCSVCQLNCCSQCSTVSLCPEEVSHLLVEFDIYQNRFASTGQSSQQFHNQLSPTYYFNLTNSQLPYTATQQVLPRVVHYPNGYF